MQVFSENSGWGGEVDGLSRHDRDTVQVVFQENKRVFKSSSEPWLLPTSNRRASQLWRLQIDSSTTLFVLTSRKGYQQSLETFVERFQYFRPTFQMTCQRFQLHCLKALLSLGLWLPNLYLTCRLHSTAGLTGLPRCKHVGDVNKNWYHSQFDHLVICMLI